jgi:hypothetical protein
MNTWYKLKDDSWGVKIRHDGQEGEEIQVTSKNGETKTAWLVKRAAKFDDAQLWSVTSKKPANAFVPEPEDFDEQPF